VVSALAAAGAPRDGEPSRIRIQPRRRPDPEGLRRFKRALLEAPPGTAAVPDAPAPRAGVSPPAVTAGGEGLANLPDNAIAGFSVVPSDATLAVGPDHVVQLVNIVGRITNKADGAASTFTLRSFFQLDDDALETDPRVIFDVASQRWFATILQFSDARQQSSVVLAVSATSDPTGAFCLFRLGNPTAETFIQDFPQIGIDDHKVIVTYIAFTFAGEAFVGSGYYAVSKAALVDSAASGCSPQSVPTVRVAPDPERYGVYPAQALSSTDRLYMAMSGGVEPSSELLLFAVDGQPGVTMVTEETTVLPTRPWSPPPDAQQAGSALRLATNDASVITAVWQHGVLWVGGNEACAPSGDTLGATRSCLRLVQIQTDLPTVQQDITFGAPGEYYYYPALSPDLDGNLFVVFNASSASEFAGVRMTGRRETDPPNTLAAATPLRAGGGAQTGSARMGDYYGAALDPADPSQVWVTAEYIRATAPRDWGTYVARLTFSVVPTPTLSRALNATTFQTGDPLAVSSTASNPGDARNVDVYFGLLLPPGAGPALGCPLGDAAAFAAEGTSGLFVRCLSSSPATFPRLAVGVSIPAGLPATTVADVFASVWPPAPGGTYVVFMAFTAPEALVDGLLGPGDIVVLASAPLTFFP
jgi:hypothetical protein